MTPTKAGATVAIYIRASTAEQGYEMQEQELREYVRDTSSMNSIVFILMLCLSP